MFTFVEILSSQVHVLMRIIMRNVDQCKLTGDHYDNLLYPHLPALRAAHHEAKCLCISYPNDTIIIRDSISSVHCHRLTHLISLQFPFHPFNVKPVFGFIISLPKKQIQPDFAFKCII